MMTGEYESSKALHNVSPEFYPRPITTGKFNGIPDVYFYICDFVEMQDKSPLVDKKLFCEMVAGLHIRGISTNGKFGFHVTTHNGWIPQLNDWEESWMVFFQKGFTNLLDLLEKNSGPSIRQTQYGDRFWIRVIPNFVENVIPRLLQPLETGGNSIKPRLIHGDLWYGNIATKMSNNLPVIFDAAAFYAHHEYELGNWRPKRNKFPYDYIQEYLGRFKPSAPQAEFDDRNILYST